MGDWIVVQGNPLWLLVFAVVALVPSLVSYVKVKYPWSYKTSILLGTIRALTTFLLLLLLINPIIKTEVKTEEPPEVAIVIDNSSSVLEFTDSVQLQRAISNIGNISEKLIGEGMVVNYFDTEKKITSLDSLVPTRFSNLLGGLLKARDFHEGKNQVATIFLSDGIYNRGISPQNISTTKPIITVGIGDTTERKDIAITSVLSNKIAYQGNQTTILAKIRQYGYEAQTKIIRLKQAGKLLSEKKFTLENKVEFLYDANKSGLQRLTIEIKVEEGELSYSNNKKNVYIDVIEGKDNVLIVSKSPHPDINALIQVMDASDNFDVRLYIPKIHDKVPNGDYDIVVEYGAFSNKWPLLDLKGSPARFYIINDKSDLSKAASVAGVRIDKKSNDPDAVTAYFNKAFTAFTFDDEGVSGYQKYPPIDCPFGDYTPSLGLQTLIFQQIGNLKTSRPLLAVYDNGTEKSAIMTGTNFWKWRIFEGVENGESRNFDLIFRKLMQYLSIKVDKRKFRFFPAQKEFESSDIVSFYSELYNDTYEKVYGNNVNLTITNEAGEVSRFEYFPSENDNGLRLSSFQEGIYTYLAATSYGSQNYEVKGEFVVRKIDVESSELLANFDVLRNIAKGTGGKFLYAERSMELFETIKSYDPKVRLHASYKYKPFVESLIYYVVIIILFTTEWFLRKYLGSY